MTADCVSARTVPADVPEARAWYTIKSERETVYWNRPLGDGRRLAVGRIYGHFLRVRSGVTVKRAIPRRWRWSVYEGCTIGRPGGTRIASGDCATPTEGKRAAELAAGVDGAV